MKEELYNSFRKALLLCLLAVFVVSCNHDELTEEGLLPVITWDEPSARYRIYEGEVLMLVPNVEHADETTTYLWMLDGRVTGRTDSYSFTGYSKGDYYVKLAVTNRFGRTEDEVKITVTERKNNELPEIPYSEGWRFPWTKINVAKGRTLKIRPYMADCSAEYSWTLDGETVDGRADEVAYVFNALQEGRHTLTLTKRKEDGELSQQFVINVCPPAGTYRRSSEGDAIINKVYAFMPAPGHQVNGYVIIGERFPAGCTHEQACDSVLSFFRSGYSVSLGGQGGYLIAGFDHCVPVSGGYDLCIKGNPFSYQSEPGIIWVSQDDNGDGLPNDQWFELAGSAYGTEDETLEYAITYYRPPVPNSAVGWRDCFGEEGYIPYMSYWNPSPYYWMDWMPEAEYTYFGSRLADHSTYENGFANMPPYAWGYVDNFGEDFIEGPAGKMGYYKLSNARTWDGQPARLEYIDFVKIQTAQTGSTPNLGEISTEVYYIGECH